MKYAIALALVLPLAAFAAFAQEQTAAPAIPPAAAATATATDPMPAIPAEKQAAKPAEEKPVAKPVKPAKKAARSSKKSEADKKKNYHWCKLENILGSWKMVFFEEKPAGYQTEIFKKLPHQYFIFGTGSNFMLFNSNSPLTVKSLQGLEKSVSEGKSYSYTLGQKGDLELRVTPARVMDRLWCQVVPETNGGYQKGDLIISRSSGGTVQMVRVFRKP